MKRFHLLWVLIVAGILALGALQEAFSTQLVWDTPIGQIGLPFEATEALIGYDAVLKQSIAGFSLPIYTDPKKFISLQLGAVAPWQTNGPTVEPYFAAGHDILREIPGLSQYQSAHLNIFGRWAANESGSSSQGQAGVGISFSYSFALPSEPTLPPPPPAATAPAPTLPALQPQPTAPQPTQEPTLENLPLQ